MCSCVWARPTVLQDCAHTGCDGDLTINGSTGSAAETHQALLGEMASHIAPAIIHNVKAELQRSDARFDGSPATSCPLWVAAPGQIGVQDYVGEVLGGVGR